MTQQQITAGRMVYYTLDQKDAEAINRRRTDSGNILAQIHDGTWPAGAQAHIGNEAKEGQIFPMMVVVVWGSTMVNGQVFLDGNDVLWVQSISESNGSSPHCWHWPPRT